MERKSLPGLRAGRLKSEMHTPDGEKMNKVYWILKRAPEHQKIDPRRSVGNAAFKKHLAFGHLVNIDFRWGRQRYSARGRVAVESERVGARRQRRRRFPCSHFPSSGGGRRGGGGGREGGRPARSRGGWM
jgi:hypothetical protein